MLKNILYRVVSYNTNKLNDYYLHLHISLATLLYSPNALLSKFCTKSHYKATDNFARLSQ